MASVWLSEMKEEEEMDVCPICIDGFIDPVALACSHNYCRTCAILLVKKNTTNQYFIPCPVCEAETLLGKDRKLKKMKTNKNLACSYGKAPVTEEEEQDLQSKIAQLTTSETVIPRNIKLLLEYDASIGKEGKSFITEDQNGFISYGTEDNKSSLTDWHAMIIGPQESPIGQVFYSLKITVPEEYPLKPPKVHFLFPKIVMDCVNSKGRVTLSKLEDVDLSQINEEGVVLFSTGKKFKWNPSNSIADVLIAIRKNMHLHEVCRLSGSISQQTYV